MEYIPSRRKSKKIEELEEEIEKLKKIAYAGPSLQTRERMEEEIIPTRAELQFELNGLLDRAKDLISYPRVPFSFGDPYYCPYCNGWRDEGCTPDVKIEGGMIVYGIQCKKKGFKRQGELLIPNHLREYI